MKKLMTVLASAATALFALGAANGQEVVTEPLNATSFEDLTVSEPLNTLAYDNGSTENGGTLGALKYWYMNVEAGTTDNGTLVTNEVAGAGVSRPDYFDGDENEKALSLDTSSPLFRHMGSLDGTMPASGTAIGDGIYLDTLVKFTAADDVFGEDALEENVDKIAISYVEQSDEVADPITNFVIRAGGLVNEEFGKVNYIAHLADGSTFDKDQWHRLTVRAIANVGDGQAGFIVYLDGNPDKFLAYDASIDAGFANVSALYAEKYYNSTVHAIYPSAVNVGDNKSTITAASFSGTGAIDDVVFTTVKPSFIIESPKVTFTWDEDVTALTIGNKTLSADELAAGEIIVDLVGATISVTATVDSSEGKVARYTTTGDGAWDSTSGQFTGLAAGDTCNIAAIVPAFEVGGVPFTADELTDVLTLAAAGTEASPVTVKLVADCNQLISLGDGEYDPLDAAYVVLDLNGKNIQPEDGFYSILNNGVNLTIINSGAAASVMVPTGSDGVGALLASVGLTTVEAGKYEGIVIGVPADQETAATLLIKGGEFIDSDYETEGVFYLAVFVQSGLTATYDSATGYVQVGEGGEPGEDTVIAVPTAASNLVYDGTEKTGVEAGEGYTLTGTAAAMNAGEYTATATLEEGYVWEGGSKDATNITWSIAKAQVTATVSLTETSATYDSEKDDVTDYTTPSVNFGLGAPELTEGTDYTVAWSATEVTGAGTFTYTVSPVAGSNYTFTEASATLTITEGGDYPTYIDPTDTEAKAKYDEWKATYGADTASAYEDAFLLNCSTDAAVVAAEKAAFKITKIAFEGGVWVVETTTKNTANVDYNGTVTIKRYSDVGCTVESATGNFFKATLD